MAEESTGIDMEQNYVTVTINLNIHVGPVVTHFHPTY